MCSITHVQSRFGERCFAAAGPRIWYNSPACQCARQGSQRHRLQKKTEIIHVSDGLRRLRIVTLLIISLYKYSYLLTYLLDVFEVLRDI